MASRVHVPTTRDLPESVPRRIADAILNLVFPESCLICSAPTSRRQDCGVCDACWQKTLRLRIVEPFCPSCGLPFHDFDSGTKHLCSGCILRPPPYSGARSFGYYADELSRVLLALKFQGRQNLVGLLAPLLAATFFESWDRGEFDLVVPVPLHPRRSRARGFNQAALLGRSLAGHISVPFEERAVLRTRPTQPQMGLTDAERLLNVRGAFRCYKPAAVTGRRVLLVDDVMTTGSTVSSASQALLSAGALRVSVLTVARTTP